MREIKSNLTYKKLGYYQIAARGYICECIWRYMGFKPKYNEYIFKRIRKCKRCLGIYPHLKSFTFNQHPSSTYWKLLE